TAASSAADRPDVPRTQGVPVAARAAAVGCAVAALVKSTTTSAALAKAATSGNSEAPEGAPADEPGRRQPPAKVAPAARTSSANSTPIRPVMPAMPMRIVMVSVSVLSGDNTHYSRQWRPGPSRVYGVARSAGRRNNGRDRDEAVHRADHCSAASPVRPSQAAEQRLSGGPPGAKPTSDTIVIAVIRCAWGETIRAAERQRHDDPPVASASGNQRKAFRWRSDRSCW